jgi:hypothetical protein
MPHAMPGPDNEITSFGLRFGDESVADRVPVPSEQGKFP